MVEVQFRRIGRRRANVIDIHLVRLKVVFEKVVPVEDSILVRMHHAGAGLNVELRILFFLHLLECSRRVDRLVPASLFAADLFVSFLHPVDTERDADVQVGALVHDPRDIGKYAWVYLAVRHQINRIKLVVLIERTNDLR